MSKPLDELLFRIRQDAAFQELLRTLDEQLPVIREFKPSGDADQQFAEYVFRSGRRLQHDCWRQFLIGEPTSQQEKS